MIHGRMPPMTDEWYTPPEFVRALGPFDLDPCAGNGTKHARRNIMTARDGLAAKWEGRVWCNPPYSDKEPWFDRMISHGNGYVLIFSITETAVYQRAAAECSGIFFPRRRIKFINPLGKNPPLGSALFVFGRRNLAFVRKSGLIGHLATGIEHLPA